MASLDPVTMRGVGAAADGPQGDLLYDELVYTDDATGNIVPQLAQSLTSPDAVTWTLKLRANVKFSDGTPFDAAAVKFNLQRYQDPNNKAPLASNTTQIASMDATDATTLKMTLKSKNGVFPLSLRPLFIASPTAIQSQGSKYGSDANVVGAGPYFLKSWTRDSQITFVRNPNYWNAPQPYLDQIVMNPIVDETQRDNVFITGAADMVITIGGPNAAQVAKTPNAVQETSILNGGIALELNVKSKPFSDIRARQAVALAIDPADYAKVVNQSLQEPIDSLFGHSSPFFDSTIVQQFNDPTKAKQLAAAVAQDNGGTFEFTISTFQQQNYQDSAQYLQGALAKVGIKVNILTEGTAVHVQNCAAGTYTGGCLTGTVFDDPEPILTRLYECASPATGWCNAKFDAAAADNRTTLDANQRIADVKEMQRQLYAEIPMIGLERRYQWHFIRPSVQNFRFYNQGNIRLGEMWLKR